jgi:hypothetical protein
MWRNKGNRLLRIVKSNDKTCVAQVKAQDADGRWPVAGFPLAPQRPGSDKRRHLTLQLSAE